MNYEEPILITGAARSGTSMTAGIIDIGGAFGGKLSPPNNNNKKGMFENSRIRQDIVKPFLRKLGVDPMGQDPLPDIKRQDVRATMGQNAVAIRNGAREIMREEGYAGGPWYYKGAKMCLVWPLWNNAFPGARWVIVRRDPKQIAHSCLTTSFMRAFNTQDGWLNWVAVHEKRFKEMHDEGLNVREMWPEKMVKGDFSEMQEIMGWLGLPWHDDRVREFVSPALWKEAKGK
jgi:hypothetical protein